MMDGGDKRLLRDLLDSWERNNRILVNLLRAVPKEGLEVRAMKGSPSVAGMFMHMHYVRLIFVTEDVPEMNVKLPENEWRAERDIEKIAAMLNESAKVVAEAVKDTLENGGKMKMHYDHPILFLQHMIWHEGYHHGQIKLALKMAGMTMEDEEVGRGTWGVWMDKSEERERKV